MVTFRTKELRGQNPVALIIGISQLAFMIMMGGIIIGLHWIVVMIIFLGIIVFMILALSVHVVYQTDGQQIVKTAVPVIKGIPFIGIPPVERKNINQIKSFLEGKDLNRSYETYEYLKLWFDDATTWKIVSKRETADDFSRFKVIVVSKIGEINSNITPREMPIEANPQSKTSGKYLDFRSEHKPLIKRKISFYESIWGKIVAVAFLFITILFVIFYVYNPKYLKETHLFKLLVVIIPGTVYLLYRTFLSKNGKKMGNKNLL